MSYVDRAMKVVVQQYNDIFHRKQNIEKHSSIKIKSESSQLTSNEIKFENYLNEKNLKHQTASTSTSLPIDIVTKECKDDEIKTNRKIKRAQTSYFQKSSFVYETNATTEKAVIKCSTNLRINLNALHNDLTLVIRKSTNGKNEIANKLNELVESYILRLNNCILLNDDILQNVEQYDYNEHLKHNGYRSLSKTFERCCLHTQRLVNEIVVQKTNYTLNTTSKRISLSMALKKMQSWLYLIEKLELLFELSLHMKQMTAGSGGLFVEHNELPFEMQEKFLSLAITHQHAFFSHTVGFQFCDSLKLPLTVCAVALASYNDGYEAYQDSAIGMTAKSLVSSTRYMLNAELRAQKLGEIMKNGDIDVAKGFLRLSDLPILHFRSDVTTPLLAVNVTKKIQLETLRIEKLSDQTKEVKINPPFSLTENSVLKIRLLSAELRQGMENFDSSLKRLSNLHNTLKITYPKSPYLILHAHGGGFIAHSTKSNEIFLKPWCKDLHVPIVSIDYSLAPEHPFPKSSEECFYVYAWCLLNKDLLGWTGEKIVCVGDSAGGVLVTNIVQRAILYDIRIPDALVPVYTPFISSFSLSPSKSLSVMDPLINLAILWHCLAAYCGIDYKSTAASTANSTSTEKLDIISKSLQAYNYTEFIEVFKKETESYDNIVEQDDLQSQAKRLFNLYGTTIYLVQALRFNLLPMNPYISPLLTEEEVLKKFPKTYLVACDDPFLDDNIEMARQFRKLNIEHELIVVDNGSSHAFLNLKDTCEETKMATFQVFSVLKRIIDNFRK